MLLEKKIDSVELQSLGDFFDGRAELEYISGTHSTRTPSLSRHVLASRWMELNCCIISPHSFYFEVIGKLPLHQVSFNRLSVHLVLKISAAVKARFACSRLYPCQLQSRIVPLHGVHDTCRRTFLPSSAYLRSEWDRRHHERH